MISPDRLPLDFQCFFSSLDFCLPSFLDVERPWSTLPAGHCHHLPPPTSHYYPTLSPPSVTNCTSARVTDCKSLASGFPPHFSKISSRFLQDFLHISPRFPTYFSKISYIFLQNFLHISPDFSKISGPPSCRFLYHKVCVRAQRIEWCQSPSWMWSLMNRWQSVLCLAALIIRRERNKSGFHLSSPPQCQAFEQTRKKRHTCLLWVLIQLFQNTDRLLIQTWLSQRQARELKEIHCKAFFQKKPQWTCSHKLVKEDGWCYCVVWWYGRWYSMVVFRCGTNSCENISAEKAAADPLSLHKPVVVETNSEFSFPGNVCSRIFSATRRFIK